MDKGVRELTRDLSEKGKVAGSMAEAHVQAVIDAVPGSLLRKDEGAAPHARGGAAPPDPKEDAAAP